MREEGYTPLRPRTHGYYVAGQGELVTMSKVIKGYEVAGYDDTAWQKPRTMHQGIPKGVFTLLPLIGCWFHRLFRGWSSQRNEWDR